MQYPQEDLHMDSMDNVRERFEALEQRTEQLQQHTHMVEWWLRRWRGIACGLGLLGLVSLVPASQGGYHAVCHLATLSETHPG